MISISVSITANQLTQTLGTCCHLDCCSLSIQNEASQQSFYWLLIILKWVVVQCGFGVGINQAHLTLSNSEIQQRSSLLKQCLDALILYPRDTKVVPFLLLQFMAPALQQLGTFRLLTLNFSAAEGSFGLTGSLYIVQWYKCNNDMIVFSDTLCPSSKITQAVLRCLVCSIVCPQTFNFTVLENKISKL